MNKKIVSILILSFLGFYIPILIDLLPVPIRFIIFLFHFCIFNYFFYQALKERLFLQISEKKLNFIFYFFYSIWGSIWIFLVFHRYFTLDYTTWDDVSYANSVYQLAYHNRFYNSIFEMHALADHTVFNLALFAPLFKIYPSVLWLIFFKILGILACPLILLKIGKELSLKGLLLWIAPILFLFHTFIQDTVREIFHPSSLALPFIMLSFLYAIRKDYFKMFLYLIFLTGFKENLPLIWVCVGLFLLLYQKKYKVGIWTLSMGVCLGIFLFFVVKPFFNTDSEFVQLPLKNIRNGQIAHLDLFSPFENIPEKIFLFISVMSSFAFLPLFSIKTLLFSLPSLSLSFLAYRPLAGHHISISIVVFFVSFVVALSDLNQKNFRIYFFNRYKNQIFTFLISFCILLTTVHNAYFFQKTFLFEYVTESRFILEDISKLKQLLDKNPNHKIWVNEKLSAYLIPYHLRSIDGDINDIIHSQGNYTNFEIFTKDWNQNSRFIVFPKSDKYHFIHLRDKTFSIVKKDIEKQIREGKLKQLKKFKYLNVYQSNP